MCDSESDSLKFELKKSILKIELEKVSIFEARNNNYFFRKTVGSISNDFEKLTLGKKGHMSAKFNNSVNFFIAFKNFF